MGGQTVINIGTIGGAAFFILGMLLYVAYRIGHNSGHKCVANNAVLFIQEQRTRIFESGVTVGRAQVATEIARDFSLIEDIGRRIPDTDPDTGDIIPTDEMLENLFDALTNNDKEK